jgi:hypothetical protein
MIGRAMAVAGTTGGVVEVVVSPTDMFLDLAVAVCRTATYPGTGRQSQRGRTRSCADHAGSTVGGHSGRCPEQGAETCCGRTADGDAERVPIEPPIKALNCSFACRGGGIRTHDLFVPNDTTSGFGDEDGAGNV